MQTVKTGRFRYLIGLLLGVGILVNYLDRVNLTAASPTIMQEFHLTPTMFGVLASSFAWTYTLLQIPTGLLLDKLGVKWITRLSTLIWAISTAITASISGLGPLLILRMVLGAAEAPAFAAASKATGYWFPFSERGFATSMFDAAAKFSNVIGVPLVAFIITSWGWRTAFIVTAIISLVYCIWFWVLYRNPKEHPSVSQEELAFIEANGSQAEGEGKGWQGFGYLIKQRKMWGLALGFAAYNYAFFLFLTWLPGYLVKTMHMDILKSALYAAIPWICGTATDLLIGGMLVDSLIRKGRNASKVRQWVMCLGLVLGMAVIGATTTTDPKVAIIWISIAVAGISATGPVTWSIPSIIAPKGMVGTVGGIMNFVGNISAILAPIVTGMIVTATGSFSSAFILAGVILFLGILCYTVLLGEIKQIPEPAALREHDQKSTAV
ncbi:MFS transporter [Aneurinibacillus sp. Ricciae_BoGa-3]|uniref:MFS transporter n=1 Tax=Aneurinibacillus sp. Ricciae_BoGa-3 TaxID=3022697 RepID=UPI002341D263|nr:MFS transporter [Aneurinibacillus sp. Ricciae_BoGa-3]WCK56571.1 MFS transporter [Aneurinibacillus sp. Ricciae_BoGa-3]